MTGRPAPEAPATLKRSRLPVGAFFAIAIAFLVIGMRQPAFLGAGIAFLSLAIVFAAATKARRLP